MGDESELAIFIFFKFWFDNKWCFLDDIRFWLSSCLQFPRDLRRVRRTFHINHTVFTLYKYINCLRPFFLLAFSSPYVSLCFDVINHCCFSKDSFFVRHYCRWWCMAWAYLVTKTISRGKEVEDYFFALAHAQQQYNGHCHFWGYDDGFLHISNRYALEV